MTPEEEVRHLGSEETDRPTAGPSLVDEKPVRGLVVVTTGLDTNADQAVAVWHADLAGNATGAWIVREHDLFQDQMTAQRMLTVCERRALAAFDSSVALETLSRLLVSAEVAADAGDVWGKGVCHIRRAVEETALARGTHAEYVTAEKARTGRALEPLKWESRLPARVPSNLAEFLGTAGIAPPVAPSQVASAALAEVRAIQWCLRVWADTEATRIRRPYLRHSFGPPQPAPLSWREAAIDAYEKVLPLAQQE